MVNRLVLGLGIQYLEIRYDEPFEDPSYLKGRLYSVGIRV